MLTILLFILLVTPIYRTLLVLFVMKYMYPFSSISLIMYKIPDQVGDDDEVKPGMTVNSDLFMLIEQIIFLGEFLTKPFSSGPGI